jgi:hypothetical protein
MFQEVEIVSSALGQLPQPTKPQSQSTNVVVSVFTANYA